MAAGFVQDWGFPRTQGVQNNPCQTKTVSHPTTMLVYLCSRPGGTHGESRKTTALNLLSQNTVCGLTTSVSPGSLFEVQLFRPTQDLQDHTCRRTRASGDCLHISLRETVFEDLVSPGWALMGSRENFLAVIWLMSRSARF